MVIILKLNVLCRLVGYSVMFFFRRKSAQNILIKRSELCDIERKYCSVMEQVGKIRFFHLVYYQLFKILICQMVLFFL